MTKTIEVNKLGPVNALAIELPEPGGVVVLRGTNGSGKSTVIEGVSRLLGGKAPHLSATDGAQRGTVTIGDATLRVTKSRAQQSGELEFVGLDSRLDISALVDPGIDNPESADAKRLKALVSLAGIQPDPAIFYPIVGGVDGWKALGIEESDADILLLAARVKRALDAEALKQERAADKHSAAAQAAKATIAGVDLEAPDDENQLADDYARAQSHVDAMIAHNANAEQAAANAARAKAQLDALAEFTDDSTALRLRAADCRKEIENNQRICAELQAQINQYQWEIDNLSDEAASCDDRAAIADKAAEKRAQVAAEASAAVPGKHTAEAVEAAQRAAEAAKAAISTGGVVRFAKSRQQQAKAEAQLARDCRRTAESLRDRAASVDAVLSSLLPEGCPLRYEAGRLVIATLRSQSELFADLSHGERWEVAIDFAAQQFEPGKGLLTVPQEAWESQSPTNKRRIAERAKLRGVIILTAAVNDDPEISAEIVEPSTIGAHDEESE